MFESLLPATYEAIIAVLAVVGIIQAFVLIGRGRKNEALINERHELRSQVESSKARFAVLNRTLGSIASAAFALSVSAFAERVKLTAKARRANIRAGRAEQRAAHFRRKLYRRTHSFDLSSIRPFGQPFGGVAGHASRAAALGTLFHNLIERKVAPKPVFPFPSFADFLAGRFGGSVRDPLTGFAIGGKVSPTGRIPRDPFADFFAGNPFFAAKLGPTNRRWDGQTSTVEQPGQKPWTVADLERALDALPGSVSVVTVGPDGVDRPLTGAAADAALASVFPRSVSAKQGPDAPELSDVGPDGLTRSDFESVEARLMSHIAEDEANEKAAVERKVGMHPALGAGYGSNAAFKQNVEHAADTGDGEELRKTALTHDAEACDTQRPTTDRRVPRYGRDPFEYSDRSPRAG